MVQFVVISEHEWLLQPWKSPFVRWTIIFAHHCHIPLEKPFLLSLGPMKRSRGKHGHHPDFADFPVNVYVFSLVTISNTLPPMILSDADLNRANLLNPGSHGSPPFPPSLLKCSSWLDHALDYCKIVW